MDKLLPMITPLMYENGGPVLMVQVRYMLLQVTIIPPPLPHPPLFADYARLKLAYYMKIFFAKKPPRPCRG